MRTGRASTLLAVALAAALCAAACKDSNTMTGPAAAMPAVSLAGTWTGTFHSNASGSTSEMTVSLRQNGAEVTGTFSAASCGISGGFKGRVEANRLTGMIDMQGCTGGAVGGELTGTTLSLSVGDFYKPLVTADQVVLQGGSATLSR